MRLLAQLGKSLALLPLAALAAWACSGGDPAPGEPVAKTGEALAWSATSNSMASLRADHAAASLGDANGRVIVCGGRSASTTYLSSCDIYDPTTNAWTAGPTLPELRAYPQLTGLGSNSVLISGGFNGSPVASAIPGTASSFGSAEAITGRFQHTASLLASGKVLVAGGVGASSMPVTGVQLRSGTSWGAAGSQTRFAHAAAVLASGTQVFVCGGSSGTGALDTGAIYSESGNSWTATAAMTVSSVSAPRRGHTATLLPDGSVLVVGGDDASSVPQSAAMRFNPTSGAWSNAGTTVARSEHAALLIGGFVIVAGGRGTSNINTSVQAYNPVANTWTDLEPLAVARSRFTLTALPGGKALAAGGVTGGGGTYVSSAEVFAPLALGTACSGGTANQCVSGTCVDGVCCDGTCTGQCQACAESGSLGVCSSVSGTPRGSRSACGGGFLCVSGACPSTCTGDSQCQSTYYCKTGAPRTCVLKKDAGGSCSGTNECTSGLTCVDSVCCNGACSGQCEHCTAEGACVATVGAPVGSRSACGGTGAGTTCGKTCDGNERTACTFPGASLNCEAASCSSGLGVLASGCNGAGSCPHVEQPCGTYVCDTSACRTSCSSNSHCASGNFCQGSACVPLRELGEDCSSGGQCESGNCVNSVCCGSTSCASGASCALDPHRGECRKPLGNSCSGDTQCASDHCADGVCCNDDCSGQCEHCNNSGACIATSGAPVAPRAACGGEGAGTTCGARCDGSKRDACTFDGTDSVVCRDASCSDGNSFLTAQCDGGGHCPDSSAPCVAYVCGGDACLSACDGNEDCAPGYVCDGNACAPIPGLGDPCDDDSGCETGHCTDGACCGVDACDEGSSCGLPPFEGLCKREQGTDCDGNSQCGSELCVDGVCCKTECDGRCEACDVDGQKGTCAPVLGQPHSPRAACGDDENACDAACDGTDREACAFPSDGTACGDKTCEDDVETRRGTCDGEGQCSSPTHACNAYTCNADGTACNTECSDAEDCAEDYFCSGGECIPNLSKGKDCDTDSACASGDCVDGVCCSSSRCQTGSTCAYEGHRGDCFVDDGTTCAIDDDCGSGHCVDGVCCDASCDGQCEACDVAGREGRCSPVAGDPHPPREACDQGDDLCSVLTCDGSVDTNACVAFANGSETECTAASCDDTTFTFTFASSCDGKGSCPKAKTSSCVPYRCSAGGCLKDCDDNAACASGYFCKEHECVATNASCSPDRTRSIPTEGPPTECAPYLCASDGTCATECQTSSDCASGSACDTSGPAGVCRAVTGSGNADESGGCDCRVPGRTGENAGSVWLIVAATCAAALGRRRTRERATSGGRSSRNASGSDPASLGSRAGTA